MNVLNMLNVEFLVVHGRLPEPQFQLVKSDQAQRTLTYRNPGALPRAFYAGESFTAANDGDVFRVLNSGGFNPARTAVLYKQLPQQISPVDSTHVPRITSYKSREVRVSTDAPAPALLVLSEVPDGRRSSTVRRLKFTGRTISSALSLFRGEHMRSSSRSTRRSTVPAGF